MARTTAATSALLLGALLLLGGFAAGSEPRFLGGTSCHAVLHPGVPAFQGHCPTGRNVAMELAVWVVLGVGAVLVVGGWTAAREGHKPRPHTG